MATLDVNIFGEVSWWTQHDLTEKFQVFFFSHPEVYPDDFNVFTWEIPGKGEISDFGTQGDLRM